MMLKLEIFCHLFQVAFNVELLGKLSKLKDFLSKSVFPGVVGSSGMNRSPGMLSDCHLPVEKDATAKIESPDKQMNV